MDHIKSINNDVVVDIKVEKNSHSNIRLGGGAVAGGEQQQRGECICDLIMEVPLKPELCPSYTLFGKDGDEGGWYACNTTAWHRHQKNNDNNDNTNRLSSDCLVYSLGISDDYSFDVDVYKGENCEVHGFDPTPTGLASQAAYDAIGENVHFHPVGLGLADGVVRPFMAPIRYPNPLNSFNQEEWILKRIPTIVNDLNHGDKKISYLKIDVEGAEWDAIDDIVRNDWTEFAVELHFPDPEFRISFNDTHYKIKKDKNHNTQDQVRDGITPPWVDRIKLLEKLLTVSDIWKITTHPGNHNCINVYFIRKPTTTEPSSIINVSHEKLNDLSYIGVADE